MLNNKSCLVFFLGSMLTFGATSLSNAEESDTYFIEVLDAALAESAGGRPHTVDKLYKLNTNDVKRNSALVSLLDYYIGSAAGAVLEEYISKQGKVIISQLEAKKQETISCLPAYKNLCVDSVAERNERINYLVDVITGVKNLGEY